MECDSEDSVELPVVGEVSSADCDMDPDQDFLFTPLVAPFTSGHQSSFAPLLEGRDDPTPSPIDLDVFMRFSPSPVLLTTDLSPIIQTLTNPQPLGDPLLGTRSVLLSDNGTRRVAPAGVVSGDRLCPPLNAGATDGSLFPTPTTRLLSDTSLRTLGTYNAAHHQGFDKHGWSLNPTHPFLFMGDGNLALLPTVTDPRIQLEIFPGASFYHASEVIGALTGTFPGVVKLVLAFGLNNKRSFSAQSFEKCIRTLRARALQRFPNATVIFALIGRPISLPDERDGILTMVNTCMSRFPYLPSLHPRDYLVESDGSSWLRSTADKTWRLWQTHLNLEIPPISPVCLPAVRTVKMEGNVLNLSSHFVLTAAQTSLLNKGLSFVPSMAILDRREGPDLAEEVSSYHRRLKLVDYFGDRDDGPPSVTPFVKKSTWEPRGDQVSSEVRRVIKRDSANMTSIMGTVFPRPPRNLTQAEVSAIGQLRGERGIVIKPADKGSVTVILDRAQYIEEAERQLNMSDYYTKLSVPIYPETAVQIAGVLDRLVTSKHISAAQRAFLGGDPVPEQRHVYFLPKIHKDPATWPFPFKTPAGRPIVSDCGSETYNVSDYLDSFLKPLATSHPSYVRDTSDFVTKVRSIRVRPTDFLFSMDVDALYTNIDADAALKAVADCFYRHPQDGRPDDCILELLALSLKRNDFIFNEQVYLQIKGVAMGKKFAPSLADIFMAAWESEALAACSLRPSGYLRYLDDIWGVWPHSEEDFHKFAETLNNHNPSIKLKFVLDPVSVDFLDTTTFKGDTLPLTGCLDTKVFFKKTDTHALLDHSSYHPAHTFKAIVKSQLLRFDRICSREGDFETATGILFKVLKTRGYTRSFLNTIKRDFRTTRQPVGSDVLTNMLPIVTTYNTRSTQATRALKRNLHQGLSVFHPLMDYRPIAAYRRNPNLKDLLVRSKLDPLNPTRPMRYPSRLRRIPITDHVASCAQPPVHQSLDTSNCVYLIHCGGCNARYVGETGQSLQARLQQHLHNIAYKKHVNTPLVEHFLRHGEEKLSIMVLEHDPHWSPAHRRYRESFWIRTLGTGTPLGLNERC